jgi:hypothetical protein
VRENHADDTKLYGTREQVGLNLRDRGWQGLGLSMVEKGETQSNRSSTLPNGVEEVKGCYREFGEDLLVDRITLSVAPGEFS